MRDAYTQNWVSVTGPNVTGNTGGDRSPQSPDGMFQGAVSG